MLLGPGIPGHDFEHSDKVERECCFVFVECGGDGVAVVREDINERTKFVPLCFESNPIFWRLLLLNDAVVVIRLLLLLLLHQKLRPFFLESANFFFHFGSS